MAPMAPFPFHFHLDELLVQQVYKQGVDERFKMFRLEHVHASRVTQRLLADVASSRPPA